nr:PhzF family phenazine biosynthesis protein [Bacteroidota bacterium]
MKLKLFQIDAFTNEVFKGNSAAVCPLQDWIPDKLMQQVAMENNLAETAFFVKEGNEFAIRWFTPLTEVDLCGHATLATAHVLYNHLGYKNDMIFLKSKSGKLRVIKNDNLLVLDFPAGFYENVQIPALLEQSLGIKPIETVSARDFILARFKNEKQVKSLNPDFKMMTGLPYHAIIVTAEGEKVDFVSRMFAPKIGIDEDPVTGSAHTLLTPYWSHKLNKIHLHAHQISNRGGELFCKMSGDRVEIGGSAVTYLIGKIEV